MTGDELRVVAEVLRETVAPLSDGDRRTLLGGLADVFTEAANRIEGQAPVEVPIEVPEVPVDTPEAPIVEPVPPLPAE